MNLSNVLKLLEIMHDPLSISNVAQQVLDPNFNELLRDVAGAPYETAMKRFVQAQQSSKPDIEDRLAAENLMNAYRNLDAYARKWEGGIRSWLPLLSYWKIQDILKQTLNVASLISKTYLILEENNKNSSDWKDIALREFDRYSKTEPEELTDGCWDYETCTYEYNPYNPIGGQTRSFQTRRFNEKRYELKNKQLRESLERALVTLSK